MSVIARCLKPDPIRQSSDTAVAAASIVLYSRLWQELDAIGAAICAAEDIDDRLLALRLELHLLLEACDSPRWRALLTHRQRRELRSAIESVFRAIDPSATWGVGPWMQAQNALFDAMLGLCQRAALEDGAPQTATG